MTLSKSHDFCLIHFFLKSRAFQIFACLEIKMNYLAYYENKYLDFNSSHFRPRREVASFSRGAEIYFARRRLTKRRGHMRIRRAPQGTHGRKCVWNTRFLYCIHSPLALWASVTRHCVRLLTKQRHHSGKDLCYIGSCPSSSKWLPKCVTRWESHNSIAFELNFFSNIKNFFK